MTDWLDITIYLVALSAMVAYPFWSIFNIGRIRRRNNL
jgi:hypothetical protein